MKVGCDIVSITRFEKMDNLDAFLDKYFTPYEREYISFKTKQKQTIAGIFAAKESVIKSLGEGVILREIEIGHTKENVPTVTLLGMAKAKFNNVCFSVSISHDKDYAMAVVIASFERSV